MHRDFAPAQVLPNILCTMTVHSPKEAQIRARIAAHVRRLFVEGQHRCAMAFARTLGIDNAQVWRVITGERTPGLLFLTAMHKQLGVDLNAVLTRDPPRKWFKPLRPAFEWDRE